VEKIVNSFVMTQQKGVVSFTAMLIALSTLSLPVMAESNAFLEGALLLLSVVLCLLVLAFLLSLHTLTRRGLKLDRLRTSFNQLLTDTPGIIALLDRNLSFQNGSSTLKRILKDEDSTTVSGPLSLYADALGKEPLDNDIKQQLRTEGKWQGEAWLVSEQHAEALQLSLQMLQPDKLRPPVVLLYGQNVSTLRRQNEQHLQHSITDSDTQLPNQRLFEEHLTMVLQSCNDYFPAVAVFYIKLSPTQHDYSLTEQSSYSQQIGEIATRIQAALPQKLLLARYQADSFTLLIPPHLCNENSTIYLNQLAHKILASFDNPPDEQIFAGIDIGIGVSISPNDGLDAEALIKSAEKAARKATSQGQNRLCFADSASQQTSPDYLAMEAELYRSAAQGDFELYYQPKFSISSNRIIGFEALLRWPSPRRGMLPPPSFMPLLHDTGLVISLDRLVFRKACQQVKYWLQTGLMRGRLSLNISSQQFEQPDFITFMQSTLEDAEISASYFELELSESIFSQPTIWLRERMHSLDRLGFKLVLDNFGEGVSSFTQLKQQPLHGIKLAPALIKYIEQQEQQRNICATLIRLAGYLELEVTAANIETEMQAYLLHVMGCDAQQGHRFSRAVPADEIGQLLLHENSLLNVKAANQ